MNLDDLKKRNDELIKLADTVLSSARHTGDSGPYVNSELFNQFRSSSLSFLKNLYETDNPIFKEFDKRVTDIYPSYTEDGRGILKGVKSELDGGWLFTIKDLVTAEIFSDFLDMAEYLLKEGYKDPAAVMIGSVLEEHLRQLCAKYSIEVEVIKDEKPIFKKAEKLNSDLANANIYNKLNQKMVTSWLDLRNKAAHGKYVEYSKENVELMYQGVLDFVNKNT
jgi:HEPN domain-containing protein